MPARLYTARMTRAVTRAVTRTAPALKASNEQPLNFAEYLLIEEHHHTRHEYVDGFMFAMAGASNRHNVIAGNIFAYLRSAARGSDCQAYMSDMKLRTPNDVGYYPDVMLSCDSGEREANIKRQPCLIVEVLSKSTETLDHTEKWLNYQKIERLQLYLMVHQDHPAIESYQRQHDGSWRYQKLEDTGHIIFPCLEATMTLAEIYEDVNFAASAPAQATE
jgi:Uma2 family endonuclease